MSEEISFGDIQRPEPDARLRPDQDSHLAVVPVANPHPEDLPIFIDIDTVKDIEGHAVEDTTIELGGVLLGGQFVDEQGRPFVLVKDSLRAQHYQATQTSFTFTHETWETICKQKDQFPPGTEIVGWYHTHPDFGIFLSGMDMFICNGFFNGPLDVALVVDPIRQDRGWFHWVTQDGQATKRQTGGYYIFGSRFRYEELKTAADQLIYQKDDSMRGVSKINQQPTGSGGTVQIFQTDQKNTNLFLMTSLTIQTILLAGIFYFVYQSERSKQSGDDFGKVAIAKAETNAVKDLLKQIAVESAANDSPSSKTIDFERLILDQKKKNEYIAKNKTYVAGIQSLHKDVSSLTKQLRREKDTRKKNKTDLDYYKKENESLRKTQLANQALLDEAEKKGFVSWWSNWVNIVIAVAIVVLAAIAGAAGTFYFFGIGQEENEDNQGQNDGITTIS